MIGALRLAINTIRSGVAMICDNSNRSLAKMRLCDYAGRMMQCQRVIIQGTSSARIWKQRGKRSVPLGDLTRKG